jgi:hypothetical protein
MTYSIWTLGNRSPEYRFLLWPEIQEYEHIEDEVVKNEEEEEQEKDKDEGGGWRLLLIQSSQKKLNRDRGKVKEL